MSIEIAPFTLHDVGRWDQFCKSAINSNFLHTRKFLSYHGHRFEDVSLMLMEDGKLVGLLPAALSVSSDLQVISHPGSTYGGIVHNGKLAGEKMVAALSAACNWYYEQGYSSFIYKVIPYIYSMVPAQDDLYALFRLGASRIRCDLSCTIDLSARLERSQRRKRSFKKASSLVTVSDEPYLIDHLWPVLEDNLLRKHGASPVHSLAEVALLKARFPENIKLFCALIGERVEAGVLFFNSKRAWHAQYIAASNEAYKAAALDFVFETAIQRASQEGARYFDFGTSNEDAGWILNDGLYRFKSEFGASGVVHEYYELRLRHG